MRKSLIVILSLFSLSSLSQAIDGSFINKYDRLVSEGQKLDLMGNNLNLTGWKGETVIAQFIYWGNKDLTNIKVLPSDFKGTSGTEISEGNVLLRFPNKVRGDLEGRGCGQFNSRSGSYWIWDKLDTKSPEKISTGDTLVVWVSIDIPHEISSGDYRGRITLNAGNEQKQFDLNLTVVDLSIPKLIDCSFHLDIWQFPTAGLAQYNKANPKNQIELWSDEHFELFLPAYQILADAGQKAISAQIKDGALGMASMIKWFKNKDGNWTYDYDVFDKYVKALMDLGIDKQISCFSPIGWNQSEIPYWNENTLSKEVIDAPLESEEFKLRWDDFLTAFKIHLEEMEWFDKTVLYLDEVSEEKLERLVDVVKGNHEDWKLGIAYSHGLSPSSKAPFYDLSGILEDANHTGIGESQISTFYTSCTQPQPNSYVTLNNSPAEMVWMGYHSANYKYDGYLRWAFDNWKKSDPNDTRDGSHTAGDFAFIYRSGNELPMEYYSSIRFELLKEGIEQYEKVQILLNSGSASQVQKENLQNILSEFTRMSGSRSRELVMAADQMINCISVGEIDCDQLVTASDFQSNLEEIRLYPNPTEGEITIRNLGSMNYTVNFLDMYGTSIHLEKRYESGEKITFNTSDLSPGAYRAILSAKGEIKQYTFIVY